MGAYDITPGSVIGFRRDGRPIHLLAGASPDDAPRSIEDREERISEIDQRVAELDEANSNSRMSDEDRDEWNTLNSERDEHVSTVAELKRRKERLRMLAGTPAATERAGVESPSFVRKRSSDEIFDLTRIRAEARSEEDHRDRLHDNAKRAIEQAVFPTSAGQRDKVQAHVTQLLERVDDKAGTFAKRVLATGSPAYDRAFGKAVTGGMHTLSGDEQRAMSVGGAAGAEGGLAVPYQLDPTVMLTSDGSSSPLRQIARVEQIVGKEWQGITSSGITVTRSGEGVAATGNEFTIEQPKVSPTRVIADVRFSVEIDQDWAQMRNEIARLLADAKVTEEDASFVNGVGTGVNPAGVVQTLDAASEVPASTTFGLDDVDALEGALPPRFRGRASYLANKAVYQKVRSLARAEAAFGGDRWVSLTAGMPAQLDGYPAYEATEMATDMTTADSRYLLHGDFSNFLIVDRLGMNIELNPHVVDPTTSRWTGQRAIVAVWRNSSLILVHEAFRVLVASL